MDGESPGIRPVVPPPGILNLGRASARPLSCRTTANPFATRYRPGLQRNSSLVNEGQAEFEVLHVPEAIGLAFEDLDFVIEAFERSS